MQSLQVGDIQVSYQKVGQGPLLVLLHGWANTWEAWMPIVPELADNFTLIIPDLPGFGQSVGPDDGWSTHQYTLWLQTFLRLLLKEHPRKSLFLAGHSFGGKIAALYASLDLAPHVDKLVLIDASGIPGKLTSKQRVLKLMSLATPPFLKHTVKQALRSRIYKTFDADSDYLNANTAQKNTLRKVLPENLKTDLPRIETPTLILWGRNDPATPLSAGKLFHTLIPASELKLFDAEHFPHHQHPEQAANTIISFLSKETSPISPKSKITEVKTTVKPIQSLVTQLAILQQAEYEWPRFQDWLAHQTGTAQIEPKKWTPKLKVLQRLISITTPIFGQLLSLWFWNGVIKIPQRMYFSLVITLARLKLRFFQLRGLTVVAIAGSYAKTSTKYIMQHVFSSLMPTVMTPENINTPYGIARVILSELKSSHRLFLAELGEYYPGDIAHLTKFLNPNYKVLTPVGFAHLERFRTQKRLEKGLLELITTGRQVLTFVDEQNESLFTKHQISGLVTLYGERNIDDVSVTRAGTEFNVQLPETTRVFIPLLGIHNAINTLPSFLLTSQLGIETKIIVGKLRTLPHIPHRLEPTLLEHNIFLLDNGYNSNPGSAKESLQVLGKIEGSQKIVITPGFVEMGEDQESANMALGEQLASVCDFVGIVTGANEAALMAGLTKSKFKSNHIVTGTSEMEIMGKLQPHIKPNAVILFENSLTEVYKTI